MQLLVAINGFNEVMVGMPPEFFEKGNQIWIMFNVCVKMNHSQQKQHEGSLRWTYGRGCWLVV